MEDHIHTTSLFGDGGQSAMPEHATEHSLESTAENPAESIIEDAPETTAEEFLEPATENDPEPSAQELDIVGLVSEHPATDQAEENTADDDMDQEDEQEIVEGSEDHAPDLDMDHENEQETVENTKDHIPNHDLDHDNEQEIVDNSEEVAQSSPLGREDRVPDHDINNEDPEETIMNSIEGDITQVPDVADGTEADITLVEAGEEPQQREESPIFEPEHTPAASHAPRLVSASMLPPALPPSAARNPGADSVRARMINLQRKTQQNKASARPTLRQYQPPPDRETYLEAIQPGRSSRKGTEKVANADDSDHEDTKAVKEDKAAAAEFRKLKARYDALKHANCGQLTFKQDVEWMKIQGAEDVRRNKRKRDQAMAQREQVGVQEPEIFPADNIGGNSSDSDPDEGSSRAGPRKRRRPELPRKEPKLMSIMDAQIKSMQVAIDANRDMPKKKRTTQSELDDSQNTRASTKKKESKSKSSKSKASGRKATKGPHKSVKDKRTMQKAVHQVQSLFSSNVFEQQAHQDAREQPTFRSRNKQDALKELIASVPLHDIKAARTDMGALLAATKDFDGHGSAKADGNGMWLVKGMKTSLKPYQLLGSAFMRRRENALEEPRGGLVADQMGLGKTLMMLANIMNARRSRQGEGPKTTLLVAGQNLLNQWAKELQTHTDGSLTVMKYSSGNRLDSNRCMEILADHDIILTTYTEIMRSYPKNEPPIEYQTAEDKIAWWKKTYEEERGVLHRMIFQRIVLDEAQSIKNHTARTSIACRALMAEHRWALSGTPILNALTELYPYFKFLNVPHTGSFKIFKNNYCDASDVENTERLLVRLSQFMIRRTHADVIFGAPILKLPKADEVTMWCDFNPVERNIYDIVQTRFAKHINMWAKKGDLENKYNNALVMLLRLRQLTAHVLMLQFVLRDLLEREDIERIREIVREAANSKTASKHTIVAIRKQLDVLAVEEKKRTAQKYGKPRNSALDEDSATPANAYEIEDEEHNSEVQEDGSQLPGGVLSGKKFGKGYNFEPYLASLTVGESWERAKKQATCGSCGRQPVNPFITSCQHLYCRTCYEDMSFQAAEIAQDKAICKKCGQVIRHALECETQGEIDEYSAPETRGSKKKRQSEERVRPDREDINDDWLSLGTGGTILSSAKTIAIKAQILNWIQENPDVKIIIYTQFLPMIRILAKVCAEEGWPAEQYQGKMSYIARDKAVSNFGENPNIRVLLASLRCGGLGLNLTMASRVIVIDPWWNNAAEQQAFCRVFRIGQKETTFMARFCVNNTVDQRLIQMQEHKKAEIDSVMEDGGKTVNKMNIKDLMRLFGNLDEDESGRPFIVVDNPDPRGGFRADKEHEGYADDM